VDPARSGKSASDLLNKDYPLAGNALEVKVRRRPRPRRPTLRLVSPPASPSPASPSAVQGTASTRTLASQGDLGGVGASPQSLVLRRKFFPSPPTCRGRATTRRPPASSPLWGTATASSCASGLHEAHRATYRTAGAPSLTLLLLLPPPRLEQTRAPNNVAFKVAGVRDAKSAAIAGDIEAKYVDAKNGVTLTQAWTTSNVLKTQVELENQIAKGASALALVPRRTLRIDRREARRKVALELTLVPLVQASSLTSRATSCPPPRASRPT